MYHRPILRPPRLLYEPSFRFPFIFISADTRQDKTDPCKILMTFQAHPLTKQQVRQVLRMLRTHMTNNHHLKLPCKPIAVQKVNTSPGLMTNPTTVVQIPTTAGIVAETSRTSLVDPPVLVSKGRTELRMQMKDLSWTLTEKAVVVGL